MKTQNVIVSPEDAQARDYLIIFMVVIIVTGLVLWGFVAASTKHLPTTPVISPVPETITSVPTGSIIPTSSSVMEEGTTGATGPTGEREIMITSTPEGR